MATNPQEALDQYPAAIDFAEPVRGEAEWAPAQAPIPETSFLENLSATRQEMRIAGNTNAETVQISEAYAPIIDQLERAGARWGDGRRFLNPASLPDVPTHAYNTRVPGRAEMEEMIFQELGRRPGFLPEVPRDLRQFRQQVTARNAERLREIRQVQAGGGITGTLGSFAGGVIGSFEDPVNLWTMPFGGASRTFVGALGRAFVENAIVEAITQPVAIQNYAELGEEYGLGDAVRNILFAGGAGVVFRGTTEGVSRGVGAAAPAYDRLVQNVFEAMPESVQRRWADAATVDDVLLTDLLRAMAPEETWEPELRAAVNVIERDAEIRSASPFEPSREGDDAHSEALAQSLQTIINGAPPIRADLPPPVVSTVTRPGTATEVPTGAAPDFERQWAAIIRNEGGTGRRGEFLTSPAGAIGPAQVMPGTAPYAARLAGLPWDNQRYRTDAAYNIALGQAYYRQMLREFGGDPVKAAAAYNAGPGSARTGRGVRGAMARAERAGQPENWEAYLPRETRQYVVDFRRRAGMSAQVRTEPQTEQVIVAAGPEGRVEDLEAELVARDANEPFPVRDEPETAPFEPVPTLRRDMFANDNEWAEAQEALYRQHNDETARPDTDALERERASLLQEQRAARESVEREVFQATPGSARAREEAVTVALAGMAERDAAWGARVTRIREISDQLMALSPNTEARVPAPSPPPPRPALLGFEGRPTDVRTPEVSWRAQDLVNTGTPESALKNYGRGKGIAYSAWVPIEDIPKPRGAGITKEGFVTRRGYAWDELDARGAPPPITLIVGENGKVRLADGNHRLAFWRDQGFDAVPAFVVDERAGADLLDFADNLEARAADVDDVELDPPTLAAFDDPSGEGPRTAIDSIEHDLMADLRRSGFSEWFGDSKIVDAAGEPRVMYRGLQNQFDETAPGAQFWTDDPRAASVYAEPIVPLDEMDAAPNVVPAYLAVRNPYQLNSEAAARQVSEWAGMEYYGEEFFEMVYDEHKIIPALKARGYDGIELPDNNGRMDHSTVVTFEPSQIRSTFDRGEDAYLGTKKFLIEGVGEQSLDEILEDLNSDRAAVAALRGCL